MSLLWALIAVAAALALQAGLGRLWPEVHTYVDLLMVPVVWYAVARSQLSAMLVGCLAGLVQDAWFQVGSFGMNGFKKTLVGFLLGALASRLDLNQAAGRVLAGAGALLGDALLDVLLRRLLDLELQVPGPLQLLAPAVICGLIVAFAGNAVEKLGGGRPLRHTV